MNTSYMPSGIAGKTVQSAVAHILKEEADLGTCPIKDKFADLFIMIDLNLTPGNTATIEGMAIRVQGESTNITIIPKVESNLCMSIEWHDHIANKADQWGCMLIETASTDETILRAIQNIC